LILFSTLDCETDEISRRLKSTVNLTIAKMKFHLICIIALFLLITSSLADDNGAPGFHPIVPPLTPSGVQKPFGPYYCQSMCLASCLETYLAPNIDECQKFCPPFEQNVPCKADDEGCWRTCGEPKSAFDHAVPDATTFTPVTGQDGQERDPYVIEMAWESVPNASLYIVEFYPVNRTPKAGESNFFQSMTASLTYKVVKEDECVEYVARVIAVNSYGISDPTYTYLSAPVPSMTGEHFALRKMQRDPYSTEMVTVTIDYSFPLGWTADDIDIDGLRITAVDCRGPLGLRTFGSLASPTSELNPSYEAIIGKSPTTAIQLSFFGDVVQANCLFQMRIMSLTTRCNTTTSFDQNAPGIDFRISCGSIEGICDNDTTPNAPPPALAPIPVPRGVAVDSDIIGEPMNLPGYLPPGINQPQDSSSVNVDNMPTPPPLPLFIIGEGQQAPDAQPLSPASSISIIDIAANGTGIERTAIIPQAMLPPLCELDMLDVIPSLSALSPSLVDLTVVWLERQPLPPPPPALYFSIRYGPTIRKLVDDGREPTEIIPGYETIVRTGLTSLPDITRQINLSGIQRSSLLKVQICAIFDPNSEPLIDWGTAPSNRIDLAALEPFIELENVPPTPPEMIDALTGDIISPPAYAPLPSTDDTVDVPVIIAVEVDPNGSSNMYWISVIGCVMLVILTAMLVFICVRRTCNTRRRMKYAHSNKPMVFVNTVPAQPLTINEVVKVPLS
jgi:hypothetical protein